MSKVFFRVRHEEGAVVLEPVAGEARAASTAVTGSGVLNIKAVVIAHVDGLGPDENPKEVAEKVAEGLGIDPGTSAVFLTAAKLPDSFARAVEGPVDVAATVGLYPLACVNGLQDWYLGTINTVIGINECLDVSALIEVAHLAGAVKAAALSDLGAGCGKGRCYGTVTDAVLVASRPCDGVRYAGPATPIGSSVVKALYKVITEKGPELVGPSVRLKWITGLSEDELIDAITELYEVAPVPGVGKDIIKEWALEELREVTSDPNVWLLLMAAQALDLAASSGTVPGLSRGDYLRDSSGVVADEVIGMGISLYINGLRGLFAYYWADRVKERIPTLSGLPMFADDAAASLAASILSRIYDRLLRGGGSEGSDNGGRRGS